MSDPRVEVTTDESGEFTYTTITYPGWEPFEPPKPKRWRQIAWLTILVTTLLAELWLIGGLLW